MTFFSSLPECLCGLSTLTSVTTGWGVKCFRESIITTGDECTSDVDFMDVFDGISDTSPVAAFACRLDGD